MMEKTNQRHILIIGGAGYIGSVLARILLSKGYSVRILDNLIYENGASISDLETQKNYSFINGSFGDQKVLNEALEGITDVALLAALVGDPICKKYPELAKKTNLEFPIQLLETINNSQVDKFVFTSTCSNYGLMQGDVDATEESDLNPKSLYAETKVAFEKHILENLDNFSFCPAILRLSTAFGISNRMRFDLTISEFTKELSFGKDLLVYDENTWRPYAHVNDISKAIITVFESPKELVFGEVFNVGGNKGNFTKKMIADVIAEHIENPNIAYKEGGFDPRNYRVSFNKIKNKLNFSPDFSVEAAVERLNKSIEKGFYKDIELRKNFYGNYFIDSES